MFGTTGDLWIFAYGSLMWRPGFHFEEQQPALVHGYHRSLCIFSHVHRGTPEMPGLVLGLDQGGACRGLAYRVAKKQCDATIAYLRERELVTTVYREVWLKTRLSDCRTVLALAYVVDSRHSQYAGRLHKPDLLRHVLQGQGVSGSNIDYIDATHKHLMALGIQDPTLSWLADNIQP
jgi:cation transport protein ChaC